MSSIEAPTSCPACEGSVTWLNDLLYCSNDLCTAKSSKKIEHFAKTLKIKGLGPRTIEKLQLVDIPQLFALSLDDIKSLLGSDRLAEKLFDELKKAEKAPANVLLPGFGVPLIGKTAAAKLAEVCDTLFDIGEDTCLAAGIGPKATKNLLSWLETEFMLLVAELPFSYAFEKPIAKEMKKGIVCITGKLSSVKTKAEAKLLLEEAGYTVKSTLTKDVTILVNESAVFSAKTKKAQEDGVRIVTNLTELIGD